MHNSPATAAFTKGWRRHSLRLYGGCCIGANALLALKGLAMHDPFLQAAGLGSVLAQGFNLAKGDPVKAFTIPTIILGAALFMAGGVHGGNLAQMCFGAVKAVGVSTLFYGKHIAAACRRLVPAGGRLSQTTRQTMGLNPVLVGEAILAVAALALGVDGYRQLSHGLAIPHSHDVLGGVLTIGAALGLVAGQRFAANGHAVPAVAPSPSPYAR